MYHLLQPRPHYFQTPEVFFVLNSFLTCKNNLCVCRLTVVLKNWKVSKSLPKIQFYQSVVLLRLYLLSSSSQSPSIHFSCFPIMLAIMSDGIIRSGCKAAWLLCLSIKEDECDLGVREREKSFLWKRGILLCSFTAVDGNLKLSCNKHPVQSRVISSLLSGITCRLHTPETLFMMMTCGQNVSN